MAKNVIYYLLAFVLLLVPIAGCIPSGTGDENTQSPQQPPEVQQPTQTPHQLPEIKPINFIASNKQRVVIPAFPTDVIKDLTEDNLVFALELYSFLQTQEGNLFLSPYSISQALAMTYAGAKGETEEQMAKTLHFGLPQEKLHSVFNDLDIQLSQGGENTEAEDGQEFRLNIVNAAWGQQGYTFLPEYLDILAQYYGAGMRLLDFITEPEPSRIIINDWVSDQTEDRIEDLLPSGAINIATRLVLTNAIYFNASWLRPFKEELTHEGIFHLVDDKDISVSMMRQNGLFGYVKGSNYQAVELPYSVEGFSMVIILPDEGEYESFEKSLNQQTISNITESIGYSQLSLSMPKFEFGSKLDLKEILAVMGMPIAFTDEADFSGMNGNRDLFISDILHKSFISVDEAGTEAAAATGVIMAVVGIPEAPIEVTINRPFVFLIRNAHTESVLFVGRVLNPSA